MKKVGILFMAAGAFSLASCSTTVEEETSEEVAVEAVTYTLDSENSSLSWKGMMSEDYFHTGTVDFKSGSITMEGETLTDGMFVVDMSSIKNTDIDDEGKAQYLEGHLTGTIVDEDHPVDMFFNVEKYPTVEVKLGEYKDGKLSTTLMILGSELTQDVDVDLSSDEDGASIKGKFTMDFASLGIPGFAVNPEDGSSISSKIDFDLNVMLTK